MDQQKKKIGCLTSDPKILCQNFIEINKKYIFPNFNYQRKVNNDDLINLNKINSEEIKTLIIKLMIENKNIQKNKYNKLCVKLLNYFNNDDIINDLKEVMLNKSSPLNMVSNFVAGAEEAFLQTTIKTIKNVTLLSFYFSKYPYLFNLLSFQEIKDIFNSEINVGFILNIESKIFPILEKLCQKIINNECILDEKESLRELQISCIYKIIFGLIYLKKKYNILSNYYQILNLFRDVDFCVKLLFFMMCHINNKHNYLDEIDFCLTVCEPRYHLYNFYISQIDKKCNFNEKEQNLINDSLTIKDFIIIGNSQFHEKIKTIEKSIKSKTFEYLNIEQISKYLEETRKKKK